MTITLNQYIDHTLLKPESTREQIEQLVSEAKQYNFASICINPTWITYAKRLLDDSDVKICTVIGFPLGAMTTQAKAFETEDAVKNGADEIDMVINIGLLKSGMYDDVKKDIEAVVTASGDKLVKVIIETCLLSDEEKIKACQIVKESGADYVKTSTGFSVGGATIGDVELMRKVVGPEFGVKAAGGARTTSDAEAFIKAGATRIGTSAGVAIVTGGISNGGY